MHILTNIKNFLYDNDNFIAIFDNKIYLYNITKIDLVNQNNIIMYFNKKKVEIIGTKLKVIKCAKKELLIDGIIESVNLYE